MTYSFIQVKGSMLYCIQHPPRVWASVRNNEQVSEETRDIAGISEPKPLDVRPWEHFLQVSDSGDVTVDVLGYPICVCGSPGRLDKNGCCLRCSDSGLDIALTAFPVDNERRWAPAASKPGFYRNGQTCEPDGVGDTDEAVKRMAVLPKAKIEDRTAQTYLGVVREARTVRGEKRDRTTPRQCIYCRRSMSDMYQDLDDHLGCPPGIGRFNHVVRSDLSETRAVIYRQWALMDKQ